MKLVPGAHQFARRGRIVYRPSATPRCKSFVAVPWGVRQTLREWGDNTRTSFREVENRGWGGPRGVSVQQLAPP